ncbi:MAG TPA: hypothetical protein VGF55_23860 [Gemmataceae bacterium]|jgi:hypothetical protein
MSRPSQVVFALLAAAALAPAPAAAQPVAVGTVQTLPVITVSLNVGSTEKEVRRVVYSPPPGWHIRSHRVECTAKTGLASYTVNTVPADWAWSSDEGSSEAAKAKAAAAAQVPGAGGQAKAVTESRKVSAEHQKTTASHHALVVDAAAHGGGFLRGGAGLELTVYAELVYVGTGPPARPPLLR